MSDARSEDDIAPQIEWLARMVAHDTTSSKSNFSIVEDIEAYLAGFGIESHRVENDQGDKTNLYAVIGPSTEGGVVLSGHTDVVPVDGQDWSSDPFSLTKKDDLYFGRGTCDMKAFSAIALSLVPEMLDADLRRPVILALSYDEEIGCLGAPRMIDRIASDLPRPEAVIVGEPTMMRVIDGHKGIAGFKTKVTGYTTHSSQTDRGVSAVEAAARLISKLVEMRETRARDADPESPFVPPYSSLTVNVVEGGTQLNIMAGECTFDWDARVVPGETTADILAEISDFAIGLEAQMRARSSECRIEIEQLTDVPPLRPDPDNPATMLAKSLTGDNATGVVPYAAEAGQFQQAGLPTVICGPGSIDQAHQADEFISHEQLVRGTAFQRALLRRLTA